MTEQKSWLREWIYGSGNGWEAILEHLVPRRSLGPGLQTFSPRFARLVRRYYFIQHQGLSFLLSPASMNNETILYLCNIGHLFHFTEQVTHDMKAATEHVSCIQSLIVFCTSSRQEQLVMRTYMDNWQKIYMYWQMTVGSNV